jgi:hypothetical protein
MLTTLVIGTTAVASLWATSWALEPEPAGAAIAPDPDDYKDAVIQVYGANVWGLRGRFAIHTWVAIKARNATTYTIYQVIGWRLRRTGSAVSVSEGDPAKPWFGSPAILLHDVRGARANSLLERVRDAVVTYPFDAEYTMWPGPNSNSFTAWLGLEVPELKLRLPAKAIGKSWMHENYASIKGT